LLSYRRDPPATLNGASKASQPVSTSSSTSVTEVGTVYGIRPQTPVVTSSSDTTRQLTSNFRASAAGTVQSSSEVASQQLSASVTSSSVTPAQMSLSTALSVTSSGVVPKSTSTLSDVRPQQSTFSPTSPNVVVCLSTQNTVSSNVTQRPSLFTTPGVALTNVAQKHSPSVPWRRSQLPYFSTSEEGNLAKPDNTASMIRRSVLTYSFACLFAVGCQASSIG